MLTYGYDYSFGLKIEKINDILKNTLAGTDIALEYQDKDKETCSEITIKAQMAPWQIIKGGSNADTAPARQRFGEDKKRNKESFIIMWKCPKCGREFENTDQNHFCSDLPKTIEEYIAAQAEDIQPRLREVYATIKAALPEATEKISWQMPTFWKGQNLIHFAAFKKHIGLYPGGEATTVFAEKLNDYKTSKGGIQLPNNKLLPLELITEIALWCGEKNSK